MINHSSGGLLYRVTGITVCDVAHRVNGLSGSLTSPGSALGINPTLTKKCSCPAIFSAVLVVHKAGLQQYMQYFGPKTLHAYKMLHFTAEMQYFGHVCFRKKMQFSSYTAEGFFTFKTFLLQGSTSGTVLLSQHWLTCVITSYPDIKKLAHP